MAASLTYENIGKNTYLVYEVKEDDVLDEMSLKMITSNSIPGLIPTIFTQKDSKKYIKYNVSAKVTAYQMFSKTVNKMRFTKVLFGVANAMSAAEDYMIDPGCILLNLKHIYVAISGYETELIYLPVKGASKPVNLHDFVQRIMSGVQFDYSENCDYIERVNQYLTGNPQLSSSELKTLLNEISAGKASDAPVSQRELYHPEYHNPGGISRMPVQRVVPEARIPQAVPMPQKQPVNPQPVKKQSAKPQTEKRKKKKEQAESIPPIGSGMDDIMPDLSMPEEKGMSVFYLLQHYNKENKQLYKEQKNRKKMLKAQGAPAPKKEKKKKKEKNVPEMDMMGLSMPGDDLGGFDLPGQMPQGFSMPGQGAPMSGKGFPVPGQGAPMSGQEFQTAGKERKPVSKDGKENAPRPQSAPLPVGQGLGFAGAELEIPLEKSMDFGGTVYLPEDSYEMTSYMDAEEEKKSARHPIIIRKSNSERIVIDKPMFKMGRDQTVDDYVILGNKYISRSHAMLVERDGRCFILDNSSKNHVSVNHDRIENNQEVELHDGDIFALASEEFEFLLQ